ncbi:MAG TPA: glycosyltransferase family 4 protein [Steroidobacteraceae bacterium]|jgi:Fuc2NAc and GlcNAc transferase
MIYLVSLAPLPVAFLLTFVMRRISLERGLMDVPNERSSHAIPTPRGGGVAIVIGSIVAFAVLSAVGAVDFRLFAALTGGGVAVAAVGLIDDRRALSARVRLVVHSAAALWALAWLGEPCRPHPGGLGSVPEVAAYVVAGLGIVWTLNLYNFMDGIDGIAASEAVFVSWAGALLVLLTGGSPSVAATALAFGSACWGFLLWNWPPAKIFMGDVGSGYLGYMIAVLALAASRDSPLSLCTWLILGGAFFVDATVTLAHRLLRGEQVYEAHRSHAYQWLARRWGSHKSVTLTVIALNVLWLLPCAIFSAFYPGQALWMVLVALVPLAIIVILAGAGRRETH